MVKDLRNIRFVKGLLKAVSLAALVLLAPVHLPAAGGDIVWEIGDTPLPGKQESRAMVVDSSGNTVVTGFTDQSGSDDYYTVKIKADGSGILWSKVYDKAGGNDYSTAVALDSDGNILVTGYAWNGINYDFHTIKYNGADGAVLWEHSFNADMDGDDYNTTLTVDTLNNVYIGGNSQRDSGIDDIIILKYSPDGPNPDGTPVWQRSYNGASNGHDRITSIEAGVDGLAVTGLSQNSDADFDIITLKYGFDGSLAWEKRKSSSGYDRGEDVKMDSSGNVLTAGSLYNGSDKDIYVVKYAASTGAVLWEDTVDGGYDEEPAELFVDSFDNVFIAGYTFVLASANDIYTAKYDGNTGTMQWSDSFNSGDGNNDKAAGIIVDDSGDLFVAGDSYDEETSGYNFLTLKYTKDSGNLLWQKTHNGSASKHDRVCGIGVTTFGEPVVAGWSDMWTSGSSDYDYYAVKYDPGLLNPPTGLTAETATSTQINLSWNDNSLNEDGFKVERKIGDSGSYSQITIVGPNATVFSDTGLAPDTKYYYRVRSYNAGNGDSYYSNESYAVTTVVSLNTPSLTYIYNGGSDGDDYAAAITVGADNVPVVTGYSYSSAGQFDYYTLKLDRNTLDPVWDARYDSDQNDIDIAKTVAVDSSNDVIVSGYSNLFSIESGGNSNDIYSIKYPSTGPPEDWNDQYNGPAGDDDRSTVVDVSKDAADSYVVVGYGRNADWNDDIYVVKYLSDGTREWEATPYDGGVFNHDYPSAVSFGPSGDIFLSGYSHNGLNYDFFTAKYNGGTGEVVWYDKYNGAGGGNDYARSVAVDSSGNVFVAGSMLAASGTDDFYLIKYDGTDGTRLWERSFNGSGNGIDEAVSVKIDLLDDTVVVAGATLTGDNNNDFHVIRYDTDGNLLWQRTLDRPENNDFVTAMTIDLSGNVHIVGETGSGDDTDAIAVMYDYEGAFSDGTLFDGVAGGSDGAAAVTVNELGEAFAGGYTINASGNTDYLVFKITGDGLLVPTPFNAVSTDYTRIELTWNDNSVSEDGYRLERKLGSCSSANEWELLYDAAADTVSYSDTGLNMGSEYCYRIRTYSNSGKTSRWVEKAVTTLSPQAPGDLDATYDTTDVFLTWTDNTINETGFTIERCTGAGCDFTVKTEFSVGPGIISYLDNTACESTTYRYRLNSYKTDEWVTDYSNVISVTTSSVSEPTELTATRISETQIDLSWTDNTEAETGFIIERCSGGGCSDFVEIDAVGTDVTAYSSAELLHETSYTYRIKAYKSSICPWETGYSSTASASTSISSPDGLSAEALSTTQIDLSWNDNTASETGFKIQRCEGQGCTGFDDIGTAGTDVSSYSDASVCENTPYTYRVKAYKETLWESGYSNEDQAVTDAAAAPSGLTITSVSESRAYMEWTDNTGDETGFEVQRCTGGASSCTQDADFTFTADVLPSVDALAFWNFNEGSGVELDDYVGGNNGTVYSAEWTEGKFGSGLLFGNGQYVSIGDPEDGSLDFGTGSFTVEAWIKAPAVSGRYFIVSKDDDTDDPLWYFELGNGTNSVARAGKLGFYLYQDDKLRSYDRMDSGTSRIDDDLWHHVAAVIDRGTEKTRFYVDGIEQGSEKSIGKGQYSAVLATNNDNFEIGRNNRISGAFNGVIDEVAVHNRALSAAEILSHYQSGMVVTNTYIDTGLTPETAYTYRVRSYKDASCAWQSGFSNAAETVTNPATPPTVLAATVISSTQIDLSWTDNSDEETLFRIQRCSGAGCDFSVTDEFTVAADSTSYSDITVCENTVYRYRIRVERDSPPVWQSDWSAATNDAVTGAASVPADFSAVTATETRIDLEWTSGTLDETGYKIERCTGPGCTDFSLIETIDKGYDPSLVMLMHMDENTWDGTEGEVIDSSTYGNNGTARNGSVTVSGGRKGRAASFDGIDDYIEVTDSESLDITAAVTMEAWVKIDSYPTEWSLIMMKGDTGNNRAYGLWVRNTGDILLSYKSGGAYNLYPAGQGFTTGIWHHVVGVIDTVNDYRAIYIDGELKAGNSKAIPSMSSNNYSLYLGSRTGSWRSSGLIDEAAVYNRALSATEVQSHYDNGIRALSVYYDTGLTTGNVYRYRIYAYKDALCTWVSAYSGIEEDIASPPAPSDLGASAVNTTQINLSWTDNTSGESGFRIERCTGAGCSDFVEIGAVDKDSATYSDTSVCKNTSYNYRVKGYKTGEWETLYSNESSGTTGTISAPSGFSATRLSETEAGLEWEDNNSDETGFKIERCTGSLCSDFSEIALIGSDRTGFTDTGLVINTSYTYRIMSYKEAECSWSTPYSSESSVTTTVSSPAALTAETVNTTRIDIGWTDTTSSEDIYSIERCTGNGCSNFAQIDTVGADVTSYSDTSVCNSTEYTYRVRARKTASLSNDGGGCWTRRVPLSITDFERDYTTEITVSYDSDMQADFDDIRFYDATAGIELPYWIEDMTEGVSATILFRTLGNNNVYMYYGNPDAAASGNEGGVFELYDPTVADLQFGFTKYESNPVLTYGAVDSWDDTHAYGPSVMKEGGMYRMWYSGNDGNTLRTGYAESSDGISWTKYDYNPVIDLGSTGQWDDNQVGYPVVIKDGDLYKMWFSAEDGSNWRIGYATSNDGITWTKYASNPVIDLGANGSWDDNRVLSGAVIKEDGLYKMWYSGNSGSNYRIGYATSSDGINWTKYASNPVLNLGAGWEDAHVYLTSVIKDEDGVYKMWYTGHDGTRTRIGFAMSSDGIAWTKYASSPVLNIGSNGTWDDNYVYSPSVFRDSDGKYKMWYAAHDGGRWRIGLAYSRPRKSVSPAPSVSAGSEEQSSCYLFVNSWDSGYTNEASATTLSLSAPSALLTTAVADDQADLAWSDNSPDETGFRVERCQGLGCSDFTETASVGSGIPVYSDLNLDPETDYCYRVRAYKTASCGWTTSYTNTSCDLTYSARPTTLTATAVNSFVIQLDWVDNADDEEGYELEVEVFNGRFVNIAVLGAGVTTFTDTMGIEPEKEYRFRVRAFRGDDKSPYSNIASVTTPAWLETDDTCQ